MEMAYFFGMALKVATDPITLFFAWLTYFIPRNMGSFAKVLCWVIFAILFLAQFVWLSIRYDNSSSLEFYLVLGTAGYVQALILVVTIGFFYRKIFGPKNKKEIVTEIINEHLEPTIGKDPEVCFKKYPSGVARCTLLRGHTGPHIARLGFGKVSKVIAQWKNTE